MNPNAIILGSAAVGLIVNTLAIIGVAWKGGHLLGSMQGTMQQLTLSVDGLTEEVKHLRDENGELKERVASLESTREGDRRGKGGRQ